MTPVKSSHSVSDIDWSELDDAYGSAVEVPNRLRALADPQPATQRAALAELWGTVWHQGTVYDCTPVAVPFLTDIAVSPDVDAAARAEVAALLASIASANSFVLPGQRGMWRPRWWPNGPASADAAPGRDLAEECRLAVAHELDQLAATFADAPRAVQAGLLAVFATVAEKLPTTVLVALAELEHDPDPRLASASQLIRALAAGQDLAPARLAQLAACDPDVADYLGDITQWPTRVQMVALARELCCNATSES
jgi:hypothetical protein